MWWHKDDLADKLIANNAARPVPGMEKPDMERVAMNGFMRSKKPMAAEMDEDSALRPSEDDGAIS